MGTEVSTGASSQSPKQPHPPEPPPCCRTTRAGSTPGRIEVSAIPTEPNYLRIIKLLSDAPLRRGHFWRFDRQAWHRAGLNAAKADVSAATQSAVRQRNMHDGRVADWRAAIISDYQRPINVADQLRRA